MNRHESLAPLSREHHTALILAQLLKKGAPVYKGLPTLPKDKARFAEKMFANILQQHFTKEETLLEIVKGYHEEIKKLALEITQEHAQLTVGFNSLDSTIDLEEKMDVLGKALDRHIRKEERVLFPLIQQYCPAEILASIDLGSL